MSYFDLSTLKPRYMGSGDLPGSKSYANRVLLLAALARGRTWIDNLPRCNDVDNMVTCLKKLGIRFKYSPIVTSLYDRPCWVNGCDGRLPLPYGCLKINNAGSVLRPLTAVLAFNHGNYIIADDSNMQRRPMGDLLTALKRLGVNVHCDREDGYPPITIKPMPAHRYEPLRTTIRGNTSSQFLSALLIALGNTGRTVDIELEGMLISKPYIHLTLALMKRFGVEVTQQGETHFHIVAGQHYVSPGRVRIEKDVTAASYFLAAGAICGSPVKVTGIDHKHCLQGDIRFLDYLRGMGVDVNINHDQIEVRRTRPHLVPIDADVGDIPDAAMTLAILAIFANGTSTLRNIRSWRFKESNRIEAMAEGLRKVGVSVETGDDFIRIKPKAKLNNTVFINSYHDHRIAMCFLLLRVANIDVYVTDSLCIYKSFPDFERYWHNNLG